MIGLLTVDSHHERRRRGEEIRVLLNGVDVTDLCAACDDRQGWAVLFRVDDSGRKYIDRHTRRPALDLHVGRVHYEVVAKGVEHV